MPSQQRFEGPDLEALLDDVRGRFGPEVAIVEANRIRKGGVGGFFARELYEVVVESDEAPEADAARRPSNPARSLLDLVDAVDDGPAPVSAEPLFYDVEKLGDLREPVRPTPIGMSSEGEAFADVLDRIARATQAPDPVVVGAPRVEATVSEEPFRSYAETAPPAARPVAGVTHMAEVAEAATPARPAPGGRRSRRAPAVPADLDLAELERLGLPAAVLHAAPRGLDRLSTLLELAHGFPRPHALPRVGDTVIALVGDRRGMERAVAWVHEQLDLAPDRLMLASRGEGQVFPASRRMGTPQEAAAHRRALRRTSAPTLVVVDEPVNVRCGGWARQVLDSLEPSAVWAVVDAQRKPEDVLAWAERIGGVDAVAVDRTEDTASPASILATGLPVALVDGHAATAARWAAVLDERLLGACA